MPFHSEIQCFCTFGSCLLFVWCCASLLLWPQKWTEAPIKPIQSRTVPVTKFFLCLLLVIVGLQLFSFLKWNQAYLSLRRGMHKREALEIMGPAKSYPWRMSHFWWGDKRVDNSLGDVVEVCSYSQPLLLKRWNLGFNEEGKLASKWEPCLDDCP